MSSTAPKLNDREKSILISLLGAYYSRVEVVGIFKEQYDITISYPGVDWYWQNKQEEIKAARQRFDDENEPLPIVNKKYRLAVRQKLVEDLNKNLWSEVAVYRDGKVQVDDKGKPTLVKVQGKHDTINKLLDSAQKELEPQKVAMTNPGGDKEARIIYLPEEETNGKVE